MNGTHGKKTLEDAQNVKAFIGTERKKLTQERLKELIDYNPNTGAFTRKKGLKGGGKKGSIVGHVAPSGYRQIMIDRGRYLAHRLAFLWMDGYLPEREVDHIDRNTQNDKWDNLREVSHQCNMRNRKVPNNSKSGIIGVCFYKTIEKWRAAIKVSGKSISLGFFKTKKEAAEARWEAEKKYNFYGCNATSSAYLYLQKYSPLLSQKRR